MTASAKIQNGWRSILSRVYARDVTQTQREIVSFKIGEGGYTGGPPVPKTPDETLLDLESEGVPLAGGGTCAFVNGSPTVTGLGTSFLADVAIGDWIKPGPEPSTNPFSAGVLGSEEDVWGQVQSVDSNTQITLTANYAGGSHPLSQGRACHESTLPLYTFRKALDAAEVAHFSDLPAITEVTATVDGGEANDDGFGGSPEFFELGLFDSDGVMVAYATVDEEEKILGVALVHLIDIVW